LFHLYIKSCEGEEYAGEAVREKGPETESPFRREPAEVRPGADI